MATQYIEDPETKEQIPFEWSKSTPPTSSDVDSLFKSVKAGRTKNPPVEGEISQAPPRWVPWARTGIEMLGLGGGGALGSFAGPGGTVAGAGLGYAAAREANRILLPPESPRPAPTLSPLEKASQVASDVGTGMAMEAAGQVGGKLIPKILPFYARGRIPGAQEIGALAEREGVKLPAPEITGSTGQAALSSTVQKLPQTAYTMQKEAETTMGQFANYVDRTLSKIGGKVEPYLAGQAGQEGGMVKLAENKAQGAKFYEQAKNIAKGVNVTYDNVNKAMTDVQSSDAYQLLSEDSKKEVDKAISFLENRVRPEVSARTRGSIKLPIDVEQKVLAQAGQESTPTTYAEAEGIRKSLADKLFSKNIRGTEAQGPIRSLYDALQTDMESSAKGAGSKVHESFVNARDFWSKNVFGETTEKGIMGKVGAASPERAINMLKNASLDDIARIKGGMPEENFVNFRQGLLTQILEKNSKISPTSGEIIYNGPQIAKDLFGKSGLGEARVKALTTPEEFTFLKDMSTVGERMGSSWRIAGNPSGTAHTLYTIHLMSQIGSGVGAIIAGEEARKKGGTGLGLAAAGAFLTPYALAKLITSNVGRQYLIGGFPAAERALSRTIPISIIGAKGILGGKEPKSEIPPTGGGANYERELANSRRAITAGAPADQVKAMFKTRTGKEYPE